jgi:hypothetical protein
MDFYRILGLTHSADANAIRDAYRSLAKQYHPDVSNLPDAHGRFIAITEAYEILSDPAARARYDRTRASPSPKQASPRSEARYAQATEDRQQAARAKAESYSRMRYDQFDASAFDTVAGYVAPKMLGCFVIGVIAIVILLALVWLGQEFEWLGLPVALIAIFGFLPGVAYGSTLFDNWHNRRQVHKKMGRR